MSSTEPHLKLFELEICPKQFRLAVLKGESMLVGYRPGGTGQVRVVVTPCRDHEQQVGAMLESVHWLLVANNVLDTPVTAPNCAFTPMYMKDPSVHIMLAYSDGREWGSAYQLNALPDNIRALVEQVQYLATKDLEPVADGTSPTA